MNTHRIRSGAVESYYINGEYLGLLPIGKPFKLVTPVTYPIKDFVPDGWERKDTKGYSFYKVQRGSTEIVIKISKMMVFVPQDKNTTPITPEYSYDNCTNVMFEVIQ